MTETALHQWLTDIGSCADLPALEALRVALLGKKGVLTEHLKGVSALPADQRKAAGQALNATKNTVEQAIAERKAHLERAAVEARLAKETVDITLPGLAVAEGVLHPVMQTMDTLRDIFARQGFVVANGPEIEDDWHNFTGLNFPALHPARQMHDTFYMPGGRVLRTHTSTVQMRYTKTHRPPLRMIAMGRTFRSDSDQTHTPMFHQMEGLVIEPGIHFGHLKGCLEDFLKTFFDLDHVIMRFRPSYFPFTEPSMEVDIACTRHGDTLKIGEGSDWLEVLGCGMVHAEVLKNMGLDPLTTQGFAFGVGVERLAMLKYGIPDLRRFFDNHSDWLQHYGFRFVEDIGC